MAASARENKQVNIHVPQSPVGGHSDLTRQLPDFWVTKPVDELADEQNVAPVADIGELSLPSLTADEASAFMEALGR